MDSFFFQLFWSRVLMRSHQRTIPSRTDLKRASESGSMGRTCLQSGSSFSAVLIQLVKAIFSSSADRRQTSEWHRKEQGQNRAETMFRNVKCAEDCCESHQRTSAVCLRLKAQTSLRWPGCLLFCWGLSGKSLPPRCPSAPGLSGRKRESRRVISITTVCKILHF